MLETDDCQHIGMLLQNLDMKLNAPPVDGDFYLRSGILPSMEGDSRRFARKYLRAEAAVRVHNPLPCFPRPESLDRVILLDVSRSGIGFLHYQQLYPGEGVELLTHVGKLKAVVRRCIKRCKDRYEIGAEFG